MEESKLYGEAKLSTLFWKVVLPSVISMVVIGSQTIIDGLFLGNFVGDTAMASANIAFPFLQLILCCATMVSVGTTAFLGRVLGAGEEKIGKNILKTAWVTDLVIAGVLIFLGATFAPGLAKVLGANSVLLLQTSQYIRVIAWFSPAMLLFFLFSFVNRTAGNPRLLIVSTFANITSNIVLNYVCIVVLGWEMVGAALATGASYTLGFLINLVPLLDKNASLNLYTGEFSWNLLGKILWNGSSEGVTALSNAFTVYLFNVTFMSFYGETGVTAFTIINYIAQITIIIVFGVSDGVSPIISYNYGGKYFSRVRQTLLAACGINLLLGGGVYLLVFFLGEQLIRGFEKENLEIIAVASHGAKIYGLSFLLCGNNILMSAYFTSLGNAVYSALVALSRGVVFVGVGILVLIPLFGQNGIWWVVPFAEVMCLGIGGALLFREGKKMVEIS